MDVELSFKLHRFQNQFRKSCARFRAIVSGIGGGKTYIGCLEALLTALQYPGVPGAIIAPTYRVLQDTTLKTFFELCPRELIASFNKSENRLLLVNGTEIIFRSAEDPEKLRGPNLGWFYLDEAALMCQMAWLIMIGRLRKAPERGWLTTTPKGLDWIFEEFGREIRKDYWMVSFSTEENPYLSQDFIRSIKDRYRGSFLQQEFYGQFAAHEGLVYPSFRRDIHVKEQLPEFKEYLWGQDSGFTNPAVLLIIGLDTDDRMWVMDELYESGLGEEAFLKRALEFKDKYPPYVCCCDPSNPGYIDALNRVSIPARGVKRKVLDGITKVTGRLAVQADGLPRLLVHPRCVETIREFGMYQFPEKAPGKIVKDAPLKENDHAMDALSYAVFGHDTRGQMGVIGYLEGF